MNRSLLPFWKLNNVSIYGAEETENPPGNEGGDGSDSSEAGKEGENNSSDDGNSDGDGDEFSSAGSKEALLTDLTRTRRENKDIKRRLAAFEAAQKKAEDKEKTESERLKGELQATQQANQQYAQGFLTLKMDQAIEKVARSSKFRDTDDALIMVDRSLIEYEQSEDDPTQVTIKESSVKAAVKKVADKKPHLLVTGTSDGGASGSGFGGNNNGGSNTKDDDARFLEQYPALRR